MGIVISGDEMVHVEVVVRIMMRGVKTVKGKI